MLAGLQNSEVRFFLCFSYILYKKQINIPIFVTGVLSGLVGITGKKVEFLVVFFFLFFFVFYGKIN